MKKFLSYFLPSVIICVLVMTTSCNKDDLPLPTSTEVININSPDSSTIFATSGSLIDIELFLAVGALEAGEEGIDSIQAGYFIDTMMLNTDVTYSMTDSTFYSQEFDEVSNTHLVSMQLLLPDSIPNARNFRPYFPQQQNPFFPAQYDAVRVVFEVTTETQVYEKELKIILQ